MLGILGAMEVETLGLIDKMKAKKTVRIGACDFVKGKLCGKPIVVCKCGIGKVFAAAAAALMIYKFKVKAIINIGVAGGAKPLKQCDVVISERTVQHDVDSTADGKVLGQVNGFDSPYFDCDARLVSGLSAALEALGRRFVCGTIATGDCFVNSNEKSSFIATEFGAKAFDMESAAINQVCVVNGIPFCSMRAISDNGDDGALMSFNDFVTDAADIAINAICHFCEQSAL